LAEWVAARFLEAAEQGQQHLGEQERRLGRRAAALNHDLRNQLNLASLQLERLRSEAVGPARAEVGPERVQAADLADLSRSLGSARDLCASTLGGPGTLARRRLALRPRLLEQARGARELARAGGALAVLVRCASDLYVSAHPTLLDRLVKNLLLNAMCASSDGGEVRLCANQQGSQVRLEVSDLGRGMDRAEREEWMRAGWSGGGGSGYGSASLQECLQGLGGRMELDSAPGKGTSVTVFLPGVPQEHGPLVLLVDSNPARRAEQEQLLLVRGIPVAPAGDLHEARTWLDNFTLAAVIVARGFHAEGLPEFQQAAGRAGLEVHVVGLQAGEFAELAESFRSRA